MQNGPLQTDPPSSRIRLRQGAPRLVICPSSRSNVASSVATNVFCRTGLLSSIHHLATNRGDGILHGCPCPWGPSLFRDLPSVPNYASRAPAKTREPYTRLSCPASCLVTKRFSPSITMLLQQSSELQRRQFFFAYASADKSCSRLAKEMPKGSFSAWQAA